MDNHRFLGNRHQVLSWVVSAGLVLAPVSLAPYALAQQAGGANQQANWGQAGPPPDAQNGQVPPPPAATGDGQAGDDSQAAPPPPPPPPANQNGQAEQPAAGQPAPGQPGQWGPAGPPPDVQNGQIPPPPAEQGGEQQYQGQNDQGQNGIAAEAVPSGPVTLPAGTLFQVRTNEPLDTRKAKPGDFFQATVTQSIYRGRFVAVPRGAQVTGRVVDAKKAGDLKGGASLTLEITSLDLGPQPVALVTDTWSMNGPGKGGYTASNAVGGAVLGSVIGAIAGGGPGAAIGAAAGTGVGLGAAAATPGPRGIVPAEALLSFHLTKPVTVQPVSLQQARQLAQNIAPPPGQYAPRPGYPGANYAYPAGAVPPPPPAYYASPYGYPYPYAYGYPSPYVYGYPYRYYGRGYYRYYGR